MRLRFFWLLLIVLVVRCGNEEPVTPASDAVYFPLRTGMVWVYEVVQNTYSEILPDKEETFELRIEVADSFPNPEGSYTFILARSRRDNSDDSWTPLPTWSARVDSKRVIVHEENTPVVKLVFPLSPGRRWDGNEFNTADPDEYEIEEGNARYLTFTDCVIINEADDANLVFDDIRRSVYSRDIGLVGREVRQVSYCTDPGCIGMGIITTGVVSSQVLKSFNE